jgi:hypothetical protein
MSINKAANIQWQTNPTGLAFNQKQNWISAEIIPHEHNFCVYVFLANTATKNQNMNSNTNFYLRPIRTPGRAANGIFT